MSTVKYKVYDLDTAQSEFDTIMDILADNEALLDGIITDLEAYSSSAVTMLTTQISDFKNMHVQMNQDMTSAKSEIKEIETSATEKFKPINEANLLSLKTPEVLEALKGIGKVLDEDLSKESLAPSTGFIEWINARDNELNDGFLEAALNPIDELNQRKAEAVYHANQAVYENAYANFVDDITFKTEIDYIERAISEVDGFSKEDFPVIAEGNLYESLFESAVGVTYNDFTESVISDYETDTNGILPDSVEGWIAAALVAALTYFGGEIIAAGTYALETIATWLTAGYEWLIAIPAVSDSVDVVVKYIGNKLTFGLASYIENLIENQSGIKLAFRVIAHPFLMIKGTSNFAKGLPEIEYDIENEDYTEAFSDFLDTVFIPGDFDQLLGGDTYGN